MTDDELLADWRAEAERPFVGWDFSAVGTRMDEDPTPWDFGDLLASRMQSARSVLELGTGGGERLSELHASFPPLTVAAEGWPPNMPVADRRLRPLGVSVIGFHCDAGGTLPFVDDAFELITTRHESFSGDVARALRPGGTFLSQQVGERNNREIDTMLGPRALPPQVTLLGLTGLLAAAGLEIVRAEESFGELRFGDVGAFVYYCEAIPWERPVDFTVQGYAQQLLALHQAGPAHGDPIRVTSHRFMIEARRPT